MFVIENIYFTIKVILLVEVSRVANQNSGFPLID